MAKKKPAAAEEMPAAFASMAVPAPMAAVGLDWSGVVAYARGAIRFLQDHGETAIHAVEAGFRAFKAITQRDMMGIFAALSEVTVDVQKLIEAVREEFGLEDE